MWYNRLQGRCNTILNILLVRYVSVLHLKFLKHTSARLRTAMAQRLRCCVTNRKVAGSIHSLFRVVIQSGCVVQTKHWASESTDSSVFTYLQCIVGQQWRKKNARMTDRQNSIVCAFDQRSPRITAYHIHEWIHEKLRLEEDEISMIQIDGRRRRVFIKSTNGVRMTVYCRTVLWRRNSNAIQVSCLKYTFQ